MASSTATDNAITKAWETIRPLCKNDRSAVKRVTDYLNKGHLTRKRLSIPVVMAYTVRLKLRKPFTTRLRKTKKEEMQPTSNGAGNASLQVSELEHAVEMIKELNHMHPLSRQLVANALRLKGERE